MISRDLKEISAHQVSRKEIDAADFAAYRKLHPRPAVDRKGLPFWDGSQAQVLLNIDLDNNVHKAPGFKPKKLWLSKELYQQWPLDIFRGHIHQEKDTRKYLHTLKLKAKELADMKAEKAELLNKRIKAYEKHQDGPSSDEEGGSNS